MDERITECWRVDTSAAQPYRAEYLACVAAYLKRLQAESLRRRGEYVTPEKMAADPERYRKAYCAMLGRPLTEYGAYRDIPVKPVEDAYVGEDALCTIRRLRLDVGEGIVVYGMLMLPKEEFRSRTDKDLFVLYQHGGGGTPEVSAALTPLGPLNYNYAPRRIAARGAA